jgi:formamidopyrimidine-DNA glycosylase
MPELPEVETVMRGLRARLEGRRVARVELRRGDLRWAVPEGLAARLAGQRVLGFRRRAKYILMRLDGGESVLLHLGMSGRVVVSEGATAPPIAHEHLVLETEDGARVGFVDPRRFGSVHLVATGDEDRHRLLAELGPEPLEPGFRGALLAERLRGRNTTLKAALLDQRVVAGLGNIYVCEALFRAGLSPRRRAGGIAGGRAERLAGAIRETLADAIEAGGSSLRDYVQPSGELGYFQNAWKVYGREGLPCERCPGLPGCAGIRRVVQAGRSTFYCPRTQR